MNSSLRVLRLSLFIILALTALSPTWYSAFVLEEAGLRPADRWRFSDLSEPISPPQRGIIGDEELCIHLTSGRVELKQCDHISGDPFWRSPEGWQVQDVFFSDLNYDGERELAMLVWRKFKPWPVDSFMPYGGRIDAFQDKDGYSCHLILIRLGDSDPRELWAGSALANPLHSMIAVDLDGDGQQELAAIEHEYNSKDNAGSIVVWEWNGFGFSFVDRLEGSFGNLLALNPSNSVILLAQED